MARDNSANEVRGIDIIPSSERTGTPKSLFPVWAATVMTMTGFLLGGIVGTLGLPLNLVILSILIGNLGFLLVGLLSVTGPQAGTSMITISRASLGIRGYWPGSFLSWLTAVGWETVNAVIGTFAVLELFKIIGIGTGTIQTLLALFITISLVVYIAIKGIFTVIKAQSIFTIVIAIGLTITVLFAIPKIDLGVAVGNPATGSLIGTFLLALGIIMAGGGISYLNYPADYTRYLPKSANKKAIFGYSFLGGYIPITILMTLGALLGTAIDMAGDPLATFSQVVPTWFLIPFLLIAILGIITNNIINIYSSGLSLLAMGLKVKRATAVFIDGIVVFGIASYAIFGTDFVTFFINFLGIMVVWLAPWGAIVLIDFYQRGQTYNSGEFFKGNSSEYWYKSGFNPIGMIAWIAGAIAGVLTINTPLLVGPLANSWFAGGDVSVFAGILVAGIIYKLGNKIKN